MAVDQIEQAFRLIATYLALCVEAAAVLTIAFGSAEAAYRSIRNFDASAADTLAARVIWVRFAGRILLSLEFTLGADIIRSAIAPTWDEIGKLAAIAAIRTILNFFLSRDVELAQRFRLTTPTSPSAES